METFSRGTLDPWYVTGFVDGEGAFTFSRNGRQLALYFAIKLTAADRAILLALRDFFGGAGEIYRVRARSAPTPPSGLTKEAAYYRVCRRDQLPIIVQHFDAYPLRTTKCNQFEIWKQMVTLKQAFRSPPRDALEILARQLSATSFRNRTLEP